VPATRGACPRVVVFSVFFSAQKNSCGPIETTPQAFSFGGTAVTPAPTPFGGALAKTTSTPQLGLSAATPGAGEFIFF
jgi:hypothetical protein